MAVSPRIGDEADVGRFQIGDCAHNWPIHSLKRLPTLPRAYRQRSSANDYAHRCFDWLPPSSNRGTARGRLSDKACPPRAGSRRPHLLNQPRKPSGFLLGGFGGSLPARTCLPLGVIIAYAVSRTMKRSPSFSSDFATSSSPSARRLALPTAASLSKSCRSLSVKATTRHAASFAASLKSASQLPGS